MMETPFDAEDADQVLAEQLPKVLDCERSTITDVRRGRVNPGMLVVSKRLRRELSEYRSHKATRHRHYIRRGRGRRRQLHLRER